MAGVVDSGLSISIEKVRPVLETVTENSEALLKLIKPDSRSEQIGRYLFRIPYEQHPAGLLRKTNADGGVAKKGTSFKTSHQVAGFFFATLMVTLTHEEIKLTEGGRAVIPALPRVMGQMSVTMMNMLDIGLHTSGTGVLTEASTLATGSNQLTFADGVLGVSRLRRGMAVSVWDSALANKRSPASAATPLYILTIDHGAKTVTFNQNVTSLTTGDILTFADIDVYGPATPTSFAAAFPTLPASQTAGAGIGGDSFWHGMEYYNDATDANYVLAKQKSAEPQFKAEHISGGGLLTFSHGQQILDRLRERHDDGGKGLWWVFGPKQREQIWKIGTSIATKHITGDKLGALTDFGASNMEFEDQFNFVDRPAMISKRQRKTRIDGIIPSNWGQVIAEQMEPLKTPDGRQWFEGRDGDGNIVLDYTTGLIYGCDFINYRPGHGAYIDGLDTIADL